MISRATYQVLCLSKLRGVGAAALNHVLFAGDRAAGDLIRTAERQPAVAKALRTPDAWHEAERKAERDVAAVHEHGLQLVSPADATYPPALAVTHDRPPLLFIKGSVEALHGQTLGVVGTREPTKHGAAIAERLTTHFAARDWCIVSGLALGIDGAAHRAALAAGGRTVAVLAHGLDMVAPKRHEALAAEIVEHGGALISEYPPGTKPYGPQFVKRDRIQAGLSRAIVLVQTDVRGGSLHAARAALAYGRILAYPVPTPRDVAAGESKVQGVLRIHEAPPQDVAAFLHCAVSDLSRVVPLHSRADYDTLEQRLAAPPSGRPPAQANPTLDL